MKAETRKALHVFTIFSTSCFFDGQFAYLSEKGYQIHMISNSDPSGREDAFIKRNNVRFYSVPLSRRIRPLEDLRSVIKVIKYIKSNKIEAVFGHTPKGALVAMAAGFLAGLKIRVYYRHGLIYTTAKGIKKHLLKLEEQFVSLLSTNIVNVSPSVNSLAINDHLNSERKQIVFGKGTCGGIDALNRFNPSRIDNDKITQFREQYHISDSDLVFGFVGRLCRDKGISELLEGFRLFKKSHAHDGSKLLLVGRFDSRDSLPASTIDALKSDLDIILAGVVDAAEMPYYYSLMDVFVFPSYREGFGMSTLEASAMQVPILVSRSHGCVDSIIENETGYYIDIDPASIAEGMTKMCNKATRDTLGAFGRKMVVESFERTQMWPLILDYYDRLWAKAY